jgi:hypothetical protein
LGVVAPGPPVPEVAVSTTKAEGMREWSARIHGDGWQATRARYWRRARSRPRLMRCRWCGVSGVPLDLNHIYYGLSRLSLRHGKGWISWPWFLLLLVPMCRDCHQREGELTRAARKGTRGVARKWVHAFVTLGPVEGRLRMWLVLGLLWARRVAVVAGVAAAGWGWVWLS